MAIRSRELTADTALELSFMDAMIDKRTAMPGVIKKINVVDGALRSVDVQPATNLLLAKDQGLGNTPQPLPIISGVPVVLPYAQKEGLSITLPIKVGDECLLIIADRSIDNWQFNGGVQSPVETTVPRTHDLTDAICIPGLSNNVTEIEDYAFDAIEIRNKDKSICIRLNDSQIILKTAEASTTLTSSSMTHSVGSSTISITDSTITISADTVNINGTDLDLNSAQTTFAGTVTDNNGVDLETHIHSDPQGGVTGGPENP